MLWKNPGFTAAAVICLALGIAGTTGIFTVVNAVLLRPLPYKDPERLLRVYTEFPTFPNGGLRRFPFSTPEYLDLRREAKLLEALDGWITSGVNIAGSGEPTRATASFVTGGMLRMLGVPASMGRLLAPEDDDSRAPLAANISYGLWQRVFGGDRSIIGREILLNGNKCMVVGVMPKDFRFPPGEVDAPEVWAPFQINPARPGDRGSHSLSVLGRVKPGVTFAQAQAELNSLTKFWRETAAPSTHAFNPENHTLVSYGFQDEVVRGVRPALRMLLGAVCLLLLIGCVNVANLLLARTEARQREISIRGALGASLARLTVQFITEGLVLSALGVILGLALADGGLQLLGMASEVSIPRASEIAMDGHVVLFAVAVCMITGVLFGLTPIAHAARNDLHRALKSAAASTTSSAGTHRFRQGLVVGELALALMLLAGAGLMIRAFWNVQEVHPGFEPDKVISMFVELPRAGYRGPAIIDFWARLEERLKALPGIESGGFATGLPPVQGTSYSDTQIEGFVPQPGGPNQNVNFYQTVSKDYFNAMHVRLIEGRLFDERDAPNAPDVAIINQTMARTFWGNDSAIGRRIRPGFSGAWCTIVGVVADVKNGGLEKPTGTELYLPYGQSHAQGQRSFFIVARSPGNLATVVSAIRRELRDLDPTLPLANVRTLNEVMSAAQSSPRFLALLLMLFSGVALALAAVGTYGVISYSVAQRTREFGVRIALGAQPGDVLGIVLGRGLILTAAGIAGGLVGAFVLTRFLSSLLFGVTPTDPATFAAVSFVLGAVAFLACYIPARRATRVDPMVALRYE